MHAHTRSRTRTHTQSEKGSYCEYKKRGWTVPTGASKSHKNISKTEAQSCLFKTNRYKYQQPMTALLSLLPYGIEKVIQLCYSKRAFNVYMACKFTNIFNALFSLCIFNLVFSANCSGYLIFL